MKLAIFALFIGAAAALRTQSTGSNVASKLKEDLNVTNIISEEERGPRARTYVDVM